MIAINCGIVKTFPIPFGSLIAVLQYCDDPGMLSVYMYKREKEAKHV